MFTRGEFWLQHTFFSTTNPRATVCALLVVVIGVHCQSVTICSVLCSPGLSKVCESYIDKLATRVDVPASELKG